MRRTHALTDTVDRDRRGAAALLDPSRRGQLGQFLTPAGIARFMARLFSGRPSDVRLLDAGAGIGSLTAAVVEERCSGSRPPRSIHVTLFEVEPKLVSRLDRTLSLCRAACRKAGINLHAVVRRRDFIEAGVELLRHDSLATPTTPQFNRVIMNPPYRKIRSASRTRQQLGGIGIETSNLYTAFLAVAVRLLEPGGELVAITPRSFCNGPYFRQFRECFFENMTLRRVHLFETRNRAFADDEVLQENIVFHATKTRKRGTVVISVSQAPDGKGRSRRVGYDDVVWPDDPEHCVRLVSSDAEALVAARMRTLPCTLVDLGITVSTGRVVDFRAKQHLRWEPDTTTVPLVYPCHFEAGFVTWPNFRCRKHNALADTAHTRLLTVPQATYTLTKRFTSKEERRRVVAAVYDPARVAAEAVGFENHLNYYHRNGRGLDPVIARGLACFLSSTLVDVFFRQFNGHTQVNSTDLRRLRYPSGSQLKRLGRLVGDELADQEKVDGAVEAVLFPVRDQNVSARN
jgi:adenine-specific DNA-methyltransferase